MSHSKRSRVREGYVEGGGASIYFKTLGRGVPLLLLHGGPGADHSDFLPALQPLARRCQLVLIDERGSGRSERLEDPKGYTLNHMVKDIERVRRHLKLPRLVVDFVTWIPRFVIRRAARKPGSGLPDGD